MSKGSKRINELIDDLLGKRDHDRDKARSFLGKAYEEETDGGRIDVLERKLKKLRDAMGSAQQAIIDTQCCAKKLRATIDDLEKRIAKLEGQGEGQ